MASEISHSAMNRRERRRTEIHERIIDAALELFGRKEFSGITAREIAEMADVAEKTFFNHFPTKQHLLQELEGRAFAETSELLAELADHPGTTADRLQYFCERCAEDVCEQARDYTREIIAEGVRTAQGKRLAFEHNRRLARGFQALLEEGVRRGDIAPGRDLSFLSEFATASYLGMIVNWVVVPDYPIEDRLRQLGVLFSNMLASPEAVCP